MSARNTALRALIACRTANAWSDAVLKDYISADRLDPRDARTVYHPLSGCTAEPGSAGLLYRRLPTGEETAAAGAAGHPAAGGLSDPDAGPGAGFRRGERGGEAGQKTAGTAGGGTVQRRAAEPRPPKGRADAAAELRHPLQPSTGSGGPDEGIGGQAVGRHIGSGQQQPGDHRPLEWAKMFRRSPAGPMGTGRGGGCAPSLDGSLLFAAANRKP